jgi:hypothetical protein
MQNSEAYQYQNIKPLLDEVLLDGRLLICKFKSPKSECSIEAKFVFTDFSKINNHFNHKVNSNTILQKGVVNAFKNIENHFLWNGIDWCFIE